MKLDLHVHTSASYDSDLTPNEVVNIAMRKGLSGIAVTDHDTMAAVSAMQSFAPPELLIIPGAEYSTDCGHILALFCNEFFECNKVKLSQLAPFVRRHGGILIAAHPRNFLSKLEDNISFFDGIETANASYPRGTSQIKRFAERYGKIITGGSDAHNVEEVGRAYTRLPQNTSLTLNAVKTALFDGTQVIKSSPCNKVRWALKQIYRKAGR